MLLPAIALSFELWLAGTFPLKQGVFLMGTFQGIAGIGEGFITVIVFGAIIKARPDIVNEETLKKESTAKVAAMGILALLGLAIAAPFLASGDPDGLQQTANLVVSNEINNMIAPITPLFPNYSIPGMGEAGKVAAILIGLTAILIMWVGISRVIKKA
jgi:cobalt/nickel transport protein